MSTRPSQPFSPIERLPVELIHRIFFECLEFNLPRASLALAAPLSSEVVYTWLIRLAFSSSNTSETGLFVHPFLPFDYHALDVRQRAMLQTEILRCRWCTLGLVRKCQREYVEHVLTRKCVDLVISDDDTAKLNHDLEEGWNVMNHVSYTLDQVMLHGRRGKGDLVISTHERATGRARKLAIWFNIGAVQIREPSPIIHETDVFRLPCCSSFSDPCRMPDRLLRAPWTAEKLTLLMLFSTEAYIDEDNTFERSKIVLRQLILDRDFDTFERLLSMQIRVKVYAYPLSWPVRPNHFRLAARCADGDDDPFLRLLFKDRRADIPSYDGSIRALMTKYGRRVE